MKALTLSRVRGLILRANPDLEADTLEVTWAERPRTVRYPTGLVGRRARVTVSAPVYRTRQMSVEADAHGTMVR